MRFCVWLAVALMSWTLAAEGQDQASLSGTVVSDVRDTNLPISTVRVELRRHDGGTIETKTTDDAGRFSFAQLPPGLYDLKLDAPVGGFEPTRIEIRGIPLGPGERRTLETIHLSWTIMCQPPTAPSQIAIIKTASAPTVAGIVDEFHGPALPGVRVQLRSYADLQHPAATKADARGHYEFRNVVPGKYTISTLAIGHYDQGFDIYVYAGFDVAMPDFRLER